MKRWQIRLCSLATGGVTLGIVQGIYGISWNDVWFQFLVTWISAIIQVFVGGDTSLLSSLGTSV
jgi:hypothetical protein